MDFLEYIKESAIILIPVLIVIGQIAKGTEKIKDKYIPVLLLPIGIIGSIACSGLNADAVLQGVLVTGAAVYLKQLQIQSKKD